MYVRRVWVVYFLIKIFYLFFAIFVFSKLTTLGDTFDYLHSPLVVSPSILYSSTTIMTFTGALFKRVFMNDALACIPLMMLSFYGIYYAVDRLNLYRYSVYIILLFSLPNFGVWTSIHGKEAVGCFFCAVIAVILIKKLQGKYRLRWIDYFALFLCAIFKPQYLLFILQAIVYLNIVNKFKDKKYFPLLFGLFIITLNVLAIYLVRDLIDELARGMAAHFRSNDPGLAQSTRSELPWMIPYGFFRSAPYGMFIAFFGPTLSEMIRKPAHFISGLESITLVTSMLFLYSQVLKYNFSKLRFNPKLFITYIIVFIGILFIHYPFGFLNPGSAIRYRANFYPLFVLLLLYQFTRYKIVPGEKKDLNE
jgi:hypothetical protein